mmetsp:Transcript_22893/g.63566  ORF Transcript_22893/g.63566 Transcript_22893/m.63566 type:complete len:241 (-) Transcript_22893:906-1628(-)
MLLAAFRVDVIHKEELLVARCHFFSKLRDKPGKSTRSQCHSQGDLRHALAAIEQHRRGGGRCRRCSGCCCCCCQPTAPDPSDQGGDKGRAGGSHEGRVHQSEGSFPGAALFQCGRAHLAVFRVGFVPVQEFRAKESVRVVGHSRGLNRIDECGITGSFGGLGDVSPKGVHQSVRSRRGLVVFVREGTVVVVLAAAPAAAAAFFGTRRLGPSSPLHAVSLFRQEDTVAVEDIVGQHVAVQG